jgi:diacylglycerol kinase (ATP)
MFMKKVVLIVNPRARNACGRLEELVAKVQARGWTVVADAQEADLALIAGGDGSVNSALPLLLKHNLPLLLVPCGTANNLARTLSIPGDTDAALNLVEGGQSQWIDLGVANDIPFVNLVGLGLSTQVNRMVRQNLKRWLGVFAFILTALKVVLRTTPFRAVIRCDGHTHLAYTWQITICNGKNYGAGLVIDECATLNDGTLHGLSTEVQKWWHVFFMIPAFRKGHFLKHHPVRSFHGHEVEIQTRRPMRVDVDGDIKTHTPLKIRVIPRALQIYAPQPATGQIRHELPAIDRQIEL